MFIKFFLFLYYYHSGSIWFVFVEVFDTYIYSCDQDVISHSSWIFDDRAILIFEKNAKKPTKKPVRDKMECKNRQGYWLAYFSDFGVIPDIRLS